MRIRAVVCSFPFTASAGGPSGLNLKPPLAKMFLAAFSSLSKVIRQFGQWRVRSAFGYVLDPHVAHFTRSPCCHVEDGNSLPSRLVVNCLWSYSRSIFLQADSDAVVYRATEAFEEFEVFSVSAGISA